MIFNHYLSRFDKVILQAEDFEKEIEERRKKQDELEEKEEKDTTPLLEIEDKKEELEAEVRKRKNERKK